MEDREITLVKQQASKALHAAATLEITNEEELEKGVDMLSKIKTVGKMIKERKEAITKPLMESLNSVRELFIPIEENHRSAEKFIKTKMLAYQNEQEIAREKAKAKITAKVEKGTMKVETAITKIEDLPEVSTTSKGKIGAISTRIVKKVRITDESKLPREYLMANEPLIRRDAIAGKTIAGVEVYDEKVISSR